MPLTAYPAGPGVLAGITDRELISTDYSAR